MTELVSSHASVPLREMLTPETVRARCQAASWQEATEMVGSLLVSAGMVEQRYIAQMKQNVLLLGPYIVLMPGVALLHARPEDGVLRPCMSIVTLTTPVEFGHPTNDPVDVLVAFGATDKKAHIGALRILADRLGDPRIIGSMRTAVSDAELLTLLIPTGSGISPTGDEKER